jgi:hypothetical protein
VLSLCSMFIRYKYIDYRGAAVAEELGFVDAETSSHQTSPNVILDYI